MPVSSAVKILTFLTHRVREAFSDASEQLKSGLDKVVRSRGTKRPGTSASDLARKFHGASHNQLK